MASRSSPSLARRALLAVLLTIGFYGLAIIIVIALVALPYLEWRFAHRLHFQLLAFSLGAAGAILWAIVPRLDRFVPPGPRLTPDTQPRLFAVIKEVAERMGQAMPREVYLVPNLNAFVSERGGILGIGRRRVMGIGLALLQTQTLSQFRFILAHEFAHYHGGDTALGPWIYRTRAALERSLVSLRERSWLQAPFIWYWHQFMRLTQGVARQEEFAADALAANTFGAGPGMAGLGKVASLSMAFDAYFNREYVPALNGGTRPPLSDGFSRFLAVPGIQKGLTEIDRHEAEEAKAHPYDSHPSTRERLVALQDIPPGETPTDDPLAITLIDDLPSLEQALLTFIVKPEYLNGLRAVSWDEIGEAVYIPQWENRLQQFAPALAMVTLGALPEFIKTPGNLPDQLQAASKRQLEPQELQQGVIWVVGAAVALALWQRGWRVEAPPGDKVTLHQGTDVIEPFDMLDTLAEPANADAWRRLCDRLYLTDVPLVTRKQPG